MNGIHKKLKEQLESLQLDESQDSLKRESLETLLKEISETYIQLHEEIQSFENEKKRWEQERNLLQLELSQVSKFASIGNLTSGVAHDLNNPLQIISGSTELLKFKKNNPEFVEQQAQKIADFTKKMGDTIRYVQKLARNGEAENKVSLSRVVQEAFALFERQLSYDDIEIKVEGLEEDLYLDAPEGDVASLIHSLIVRSRDAFRSQEDKVPNPYIHVSLLSKTAENLTLSFEDNSGGLEASVLEKIFDPFYVPPGQLHSSGLGLSLARSIVLKCKGALSVSSEPGIVRFQLSLPRRQMKSPSTPAAKSEDSDSSDEAPSPSPKKRVLVLDDEPDICDIVSMHLDQEDLDVTALSQPQRALELLETESFDLLITDLRMPKVSGLEVAEKAQAQTADCKVIILSGHYAEGQRPGEPRFRYISKPVSSDELLGHVHDLLGLESSSTL